VAQVCRITRERIVRGTKTMETVYAITSLAAERAGPEQLLALSRAHWGIENCLHYVRDVSCREDQARAHAGNAPQVLAACRNTALTLIRRLGYKVVEGFEHFAEHRLAAINGPEYTVGRFSAKFLNVAGTRSFRPAGPDVTQH
jgi:predicted transposase YbfD/YdcC